MDVCLSALLLCCVVLCRWRPCDGPYQLSVRQYEVNSEWEQARGPVCKRKKYKGKHNRGISKINTKPSFTVPNAFPSYLQEKLVLRVLVKFNAFHFFLGRLFTRLCPFYCLFVRLAASYLGSLAPVIRPRSCLLDQKHTAWSHVRPSMGGDALAPHSSVHKHVPFAAGYTNYNEVNREWSTDI
jgi:hypothetical protein